MNSPIKLISTDFDGTLCSEYDSPSIPDELQGLLRDLQARGAKWVINTGRDMSSLREGLAEARLAVEPDYLVVVEREIHAHQDSQYIGLEEWNGPCARAHAELFARVLPDVPRLAAWISRRFPAYIYQDAYSPFCLVADNNGDADSIQTYLAEYCRTIPHLAVMRNDVYARFSHAAYNKGTALAELSRRLGLSPAQVFAIGDHWNDLPMLSGLHAGLLAAPDNAVEMVKAAVRRQNGYVSGWPHGRGVADAIKYYLAAEAG